LDYGEEILEKAIGSNKAVEKFEKIKKKKK